MDSILGIGIVWTSCENPRNPLVYRQISLQNVAVVASETHAPNSFSQGSPPSLRQGMVGMVGMVGMAWLEPRNANNWSHVVHHLHVLWRPPPGKIDSTSACRNDAPLLDPLFGEVRGNAVLALSKIGWGWASHHFWIFLDFIIEHVEPTHETWQSEQYLSTGVGRPKKEWQRKQIGHHKPLTKCVFPKKCDPEILHLVGKPLVIWWTSTNQNQRKVLRETQCHTPTIGGWFLLHVGLVQPPRLFDCHEQIYICCMVFTVHSCYSTFWGLYELPLFWRMEEWVWSLTCVVILFCWVTFLYKPACPNVRTCLRKNLEIAWERKRVASRACWKLLEKDKTVASRECSELLQNEKRVTSRACWKLLWES